MLRDLYIDGEWVAGSGTLEVVDPATGEAFQTVETGGEDEIELAPGDPAGGIDLLGGQLQAPSDLLADAAVRARKRRHDSDLDRILS